MTGATLEGPDGWVLDPDGVAVHPGARTAVVADIHLGYEWARGASGDCVPAHSLAETIEKLTRVLDRAGAAVDRVVVAGDLVESRRFCPRTRRDVSALFRWLSDRGVTAVVLPGNHDAANPSAPLTLDVAGWTVGHGHRRLFAPRTVSGHYHPVLRAAGVNAPCFVVGPTTILLPAFSPNAAGVPLGVIDLSSATHDGADLRCVASAGGTLLDFGPVEPLLRALQA